MNKTIIRMLNLALQIGLLLLLTIPSPTWSFQNSIPFTKRSKSLRFISSNLIIPKMSSTTVGDSEEMRSSSSSKKRPMVGQWEELHGNYILRPNIEDGPPRALLHFLGGAIVGAVPHISYRYMLESLAKRGYLVVATPYNLSFDHLSTCDEVITRFETIAPSLARQYGAVPVIGVGHSCGALLQLLITSLFPDTPRAANCLISFNNKPVQDAVPLFDEFFSPFFTSVASNNNTATGGLSGVQVIELTLQLARTASEGELPSDDLLAELKKVLTPSFLESLTPDATTIAMPQALRDALTTLMSPSATALSQAGVLPLLNQVVDTLDQIPLLIQEVADGYRDFMPNPPTVAKAARRAYRARRTLILQYKDDGQFDESQQIEELLKEAESVTRMKRPMIDIDVLRVELEGGHATPLLAPPLDVAGRAEDLLGEDTAKNALLYTQTDATVNELVLWLEEANL